MSITPEQLCNQFRSYVAAWQPLFNAIFPVVTHHQTTHGDTEIRVSSRHGIPEFHGSLLVTYNQLSYLEDEEDELFDPRLGEELRHFCDAHGRAFALFLSKAVDNVR